MHYADDILVIDDDQPILEMITEVLTEEGYIVRTSLSPREARVAIAERCPSLVLCDIHLPEETGVMLVNSLKASALADVPVVFITAEMRAVREL
jgi:CheY-like chemotaxis protein